MLKKILSALAGIFVALIITMTVNFINYQYSYSNDFARYARDTHSLINGIVCIGEPKSTLAALKYYIGSPVLTEVEDGIAEGDADSVNRNFASAKLFILYDEMGNRELAKKYGATAMRKLGTDDPRQLSEYVEKYQRQLCINLNSNTN